TNDFRGSNSPTKDDVQNAFEMMLFYVVVVFGCSWPRTLYDDEVEPIPRETTLLPIYNIEVTASHAYSISLSHLLVHNNSDRAASTRQSIRWNTLQAIRKYEEHLKWLDAAGDHLTKVLDGSAKLDDKETVMLLIKSMKDAASTSPTAPIRTR